MAKRKDKSFRDKSPQEKPDLGCILYKRGRPALVTKEEYERSWLAWYRRIQKDYASGGRSDK